MEIKKSGSFARKGMQKDKHPGELTKEEYTFAMNANTQSEQGDGYVILQNEGSNILCSNFKEGYTVIGHKFDINADRTYFFLTNAVTGCSEIGYIDALHNPTSMEDVEVQCGCNIIVQAETPLEDLTQVGYCDYVTLMSDCCPDFPDVDPCLNFNADYPIRETNVQIKDERTGKRMYFTDGFNPPRYIRLDDIEDYYTLDDGCTEPVDACLQCEMLRVFPLFNKPCVNARVIQSGGNLKAGVYEVTIAYSNNDGQEVSSYFSTTNPIPIFDQNQVILTQDNLDYLTNFAIGIDVDNLDNSYDYYKAVVIYRSGLDQSVSYRVIGVFPTSTNKITLATLINTDTITDAEIKVRKPFYLTSRGMAAANGHLFQFGLTTQRELNLQPVVNLMGGFVKWNTSVALEDLYEDGVNVSKYTGFMRDEVVPLSIKFYMTGGLETPNFTFVPRPPTADELTEYVNVAGEILVTDINVDSVLEYNPECADNNRRFKWQFENTATIDAEPCNTGFPTIEVVREQSFTCTVKDILGDTKVVGTVAGPTTLTLDYSVGILQYITENRAAILASTDPQWAAVKAILISEYPLETCEPDVPDLCGALTLDNYLIYPFQVTTEVSSEVPFVFADYDRVASPVTCSTIRTDVTTGALIQDSSFMSDYMDAGEVVYEKLTVANQSCATAITPFIDTIPVTALGSHLVDKGTTVTDAALRTTKDADVSGLNFKSKLHTNAIWFKLDFAGRDKVIIEVSPTLCTNNDDNTGTSIRVSAYVNCSTNSNLSSYTKIISNLSLTPDPNKFIELDSADFGGTSGTAYLAIDSEMTETVIGGVTVFRLAPPCGCFFVIQRDVEYNTEVVVTGLDFAKDMTYTTECTYNLPDVSKLGNCDVVPFEKGKFSYWESSIKYPCNRELWDSSELTITTADIPTAIKPEFEDYYTTAIVGGNYVLDQAQTDFRDKPIRHYKFPCSNKVPHMSSPIQDMGEFNKALIYPIGFTIDNEVIEAFLDIAVKNNMITQEERSKITKYEIFRGDRRSQKSIVAKGVLFDTYQYTENNSNSLNDRVHYTNYPLNTLGTDVFNGVNHPYNSLGNKEYTFHSPDTHFYNPTLPPEIKFEGYLYGRSLNYFDEVREHPKFVVLGQLAFTTATTLAIAEVAFDLFLQGANWLLESSSAHPVTVIPSTAIAVVAIAGITTQSFFKVGQLRQNWINIFRGLGKPEQFAYYQASIGYYTNFRNNIPASSRYRGLPVRTYLKEGRWNVNNAQGQAAIAFNNLDGEASVFLGMGKPEYLVLYSNEYRLADNQTSQLSNTTRRVYGGVGRSGKIEANTALLYATLKNYLPNQYGDINSVEWLSTNYCGDLSTDNTCDIVFGGDTYISRFAVKRKLPFFTTTAFRLANNTPYKYSDYFNINPPEVGVTPTNRLFLDYMLNDDYNNPLAATVFPSNRSQFVFNPSGLGSFYVKPPAKFYLYSYGFPHFLVESQFNCNYRYAKNQPPEDFYPNKQDVIALTQESLISIREPERFYFNTAYLSQGSRNPWWTLPDNYTSKLYDRINNLKNSVIYSRVDSSEIDVADPWLSYRPLDFYNFPTTYGDLVDIDTIESEQILARFTNGMSMFNAVDQIADRLTPETFYLGQGGIFAGRNVNFNKTQLGYAGTQHTAKVSTNFGHYWADAKRGQVFELAPNGQGLKEITAGLEKWFKDSLPFKLTISFPEYDTDNAYKDVGLTMGWDERSKRVFLTKRDYRYIGEGLEYTDGGFYITAQESNCDTDNVLPAFGTGEVQMPWATVGSWSTLDGVAVFTPSGINVGALSIRLDLQQGCFNLTGDVCNFFGSYVEVSLGSQSHILDADGCTTFDIQFDVPSTGNYTLLFRPRDTEGFEGQSTLTNLCLVPCPDRELIQLGDERFFQECSWTIAYSPILQGWVSYYSFVPNYYVSYNDYFQTGLNEGQSSIWSHLPFISSYQVFYGEINPFTVEYPKVGQGMNSTLQDINYHLDVFKYYNKWDLADVPGFGFNKAVVYNADQNTGLMNLIYTENDNLYQQTQYPRYNASSVDVLQTEISGRWSFNHLYNIIKNERSKLPVWLNDCSNVNKELNNQLLDYRPIYKDRLRGQYFLARLIQDVESRYKMIFRYATDKRGFYEQ